MQWIDVDKETNEQSRGGLGLEQMLLPLLLIMTFGMTGAMVVPLLLVEEKEKRTLDFLLSSPASLKEIVAGKALTGAAYSRADCGSAAGYQSRTGWKLAVNLCSPFYWDWSLWLR